MTELNRLIGQLDNIAERTEAGVSEKYDAESIREAASILRAAASVDVAGLMELAEAMANAAYASAVDYINGAGADSTKEVEAEAALESALRMALAAREGFVMVPVEPSKLDSQIHDSSSTHVHATVEAACWGEYTIEASRDDESRNWYITVTSPSGIRDYDGCWRNSAFKTVDDVINEAILGACLMAIQEPPKAAAAPKGTP